MDYPVSVIVPVYNVAPYLPRCLDSILAQTYREFQLILVDDGSTDGCREICDEYAARDGRITVIHKENGGLSSARNAGLEQSEGDFISFLDSDDWIHPQFLELMLRAQQAKDYDLVICDHQRVYESAPFQHGDVSVFTPRELNLEDVYRHPQTKSYVWNKLYRRSLIGNHRFIEEKIAEDAAFNAIVLGSCPDLRACFIPEILYFYCYRDNSLIHHLTLASQLRLAEIILGYAQTACGSRIRRLYLRELLKCALSVRYKGWVLGLDKAGKVRCRQCLREGLSLFWRCPGSFSEKVAFTVLWAVPQAYRVWRIREDPTLLKWEADRKKQKQRP